MYDVITWENQLKNILAFSSFQQRCQKDIYLKTDYIAFSAFFGQKINFHVKV